MKSKIMLLISCALAVMMLASCTDADVVVDRGESAAPHRFPEEGSVAVVINISSGTFHLDENCRYVVGMKEENKKTVLFSDAGQAVTAGFKPCSGCADEYKKTEENND